MIEKHKQNNTPEDNDKVERFEHMLEKEKQKNLFLQLIKLMFSKNKRD